MRIRTDIRHSAKQLRGKHRLLSRQTCLAISVVWPALITGAGAASSHQGRGAQVNLSWCKSRCTIKPSVIKVKLNSIIHFNFLALRHRCVVCYNFLLRKRRAGRTANMISAAVVGRCCVLRRRLATFELEITLPVRCTMSTASIR